MKKTFLLTIIILFVSLLFVSKFTFASEKVSLFGITLGESLSKYQNRVEIRSPQKELTTFMSFKPEQTTPLIDIYIA